MPLIPCLLSPKIPLGLFINSKTLQIAITCLKTPPSNSSTSESYALLHPTSFPHFHNNTYWLTSANNNNTSIESNGERPTTYSWFTDQANQFDYNSTNTPSPYKTTSELPNNSGRIQQFSMQSRHPNYESAYAYAYEMPNDVDLEQSMTSSFAHDFGATSHQSSSQEWLQQSPMQSRHPNYESAYAYAYEMPNGVDLEQSMTSSFAHDFGATSHQSSSQEWLQQPPMQSRHPDSESTYAYAYEPPITSCILCFEKNDCIQLHQLGIERTAQKTLTYTLSLIHAPSVDYWAKYKKLITDNLNSPTTLYSNLINSLQKEKTNDDALATTYPELQNNNSLPSNLLELDDILSTYLGCSLVDICKPTYQEISKLLSQSNLQHIFHLLLTIRKTSAYFTDRSTPIPLLLIKKENDHFNSNNNDCVDNSAFDSFEEFLLLPSRLMTPTSTSQQFQCNLADQQHLFPSETQTLRSQQWLTNFSEHQIFSSTTAEAASMPLRFAEDVNTNQSPSTYQAIPPLASVEKSSERKLLACPHIECAEKKIKVPTHIDSPNIFFELIEPLTNSMATCKKMHNTEHKLYLTIITNEKNGVLETVKNGFIEINIAKVDGSLPKLLKTFDSSPFNYKDALNTLKILNNETPTLPDKKVAYEVFNSYLQKIAIKKPALLEEQIKIMGGIIFANKIINIIGLLKKNNQEAEANPVNIYLMTQKIHLKKLEYLLLELQKSINSTEDQPYKALAFSSRSTAVLANSDPVLIEQIALSESALKVEYATKISSKDIRKAIQELTKKHPITPQTLDHSPTTIHALCLPFRAKFQLIKFISLDIDNTHLSIVSLKKQLLIDWNLLFRTVCRKPTNTFIPAIIKLLLPKENYDGTSLNTLISNNLTTIQKLLTRLVGVRFFLILYQNLIEKDKTISTKHYFSLETIEKISAKIKNNKLDDIFTIDNCTLQSKVKNEFTDGHINKVLAFFMQKWELPTELELEALNIHKKKPSKKRASNTQNTSPPPPSKIAKKSK